jgi:hypothetical protein
MANFDVQIQALAGTATQTEMDDWATDAVKEIINILPYKLKIECATMTQLTSSTPMDLDITGEIFHVTRENADAGYHTPCRKIPGMYGGLAEDSSNLMFYATLTDPVYWIESDTGGDPKLFVKPTPTANQPARVHHVAFPSVDVSAVSAIVNFPNEAEYLVVLYTAIKVLQNKMNEMDTISAIDTTALGAMTTELAETQALADTMNTHIGNAITQIGIAVTEAAEIATQTDNSSDFATALTALNSAVDKFRADASDPALFGDETQYETGVGMAHVKDALEKARTLISDDAEHAGLSDVTDNPSSGTYSVLYWLGDEDTEMAEATMKMVATEIERAKTHMEEWRISTETLNAEIDGFAKEVTSRATFTGAKKAAVETAITTASEYLSASERYAAQIDAKISISQAHGAEVKMRMARETQKYEWYDSQQKKLQQDYVQGIQLLIGQGASAQKDSSGMSKKQLNKLAEQLSRVQEER